VNRAGFLVAAAASLWCAGVGLYQLQDLYIQFQRPTYWEHASYATMFPYVVPVVATLSIIAGALAIAGFAKRRENLLLAARAERTAILVGVTQLLTLGILGYLLPEAHGTSSFLLLTLMALTLGLIAIVNAARLICDAAVVVETAPPTIPTAQLL